MKARHLLAGAALFIFAAPAFATETADLSALAGRWTFTTAPQDGTGCVIRGNVNAVRRDNRLNMSIHTLESCPSGGQYRALERCTGVLARSELTVRCEIVRATPSNYNADDFILTSIGATQMSGRLDDHHSWNVPVTWRRPEAPLVS